MIFLKSGGGYCFVKFLIMSSWRGICRRRKTTGGGGGEVSYPRASGFHAHTIVGYNDGVMASKLVGPTSEYL